MALSMAQASEWRDNILALASNLWVPRIVLCHVALATSTGGIDIGFDCRSYEVWRRAFVGRRTDVAYEVLQVS